MSAFKDGEKIDWATIDETRTRLVRMRFKNYVPEEATIGLTPCGDLSDRLSRRQSDRQSMTRWFDRSPALDIVKLEKQIRENVYRRKTEEIVADDDWTLKHNTQGAYETLLLPGINYDICATVDDDEPQIAGFIEAHQIPVMV